MVSELKLTKNESRYLKLIYRRQSEEEEKIKTTSIAKKLGVRPATVTETFQNLSGKGLLRHERYHGVELTDKGNSKAKALLRKHRLLETLFAKLLNYKPQEACIEASRLDYHVSHALINSICQNYGHPNICPCDKEIPEDPECKTNRETTGDIL